MTAELLPCPFCGGSARIENTTSYYDSLHGERQWWGVVCRNTENVGGTCAIQQRPSASEKTAADRWNHRAQPPAASQPIDGLERAFRQLDERAREHAESHDREENEYAAGITDALTMIRAELAAVQGKK